MKTQVYRACKFWLILTHLTKLPKLRVNIWIYVDFLILLWKLNKKQQLIVAFVEVKLGVGPNAIPRHGLM